MGLLVHNQYRVILGVCTYLGRSYSVGRYVRCNPTSCHKLAQARKRYKTYRLKEEEEENFLIGT